ncbi:ribosomal protein L22 (plastid) [Cryptomonas paramecium]|uniref:Large ribosomal subunit protein uL22c n=1 Tax=Cryptomonas paramaecium TaxID=2898 RepID=D2IS99_9CRYP|nr:ribosomal protein L22 [Cryptomonas paramecium]ACT46791.1 ribosomal protein L22 [Cryptomonas paramecium]BDA98004.1 ribosomal protein L22 [Cryptomonas paramecium]
MSKAVAKYIRVAPNKIRRVVNQIRGKSYSEALIILEFMPYSACKPVLSLLHSAGSNAENNDGVKKSVLYVSEVYVDSGPSLKRLRPRAQGRAYTVRKRFSHISLQLSRIEK